MFRYLSLLALVTVTVIIVGNPALAQDPLTRARALHQQVPLIDGHNDYPWALRGLDPGRDFSKAEISKPVPSLMTDIPRLRQGGLGGQFWSVYTPSTMTGQEAVRVTLEQIDIVHRMTKRWPETFEMAYTAADVERSFKAGRIGSLIGMEGGHSIDDSLPTLRMFFALGARYLTLTHNGNLRWADAAADKPAVGGLSKFGEEVVREMNRMGMLVDLSHVSSDTMADALRVSEAPVIFSHSSARAICNVPRNVPDNVLQLTARNGGVVMVTFVPGFISQAVADYDAKPAAERGPTPPKATLAQVADHIDHIRKVAGIDHLGLGGDFDGITQVVVGLEDVSKYPDLTAELIKRGYTDEDLKKILGLNVLRVMKQAEAVAARLQKTRQPSTATIEQLDAK
ncbi:MAG: membrane dipeptidase [Acidobacteria bacterium]|nr:membrane dipeptidase [Acidobacteriota bacterium]